MNDTDDGGTLESESEANSEMGSEANSEMESQAGSEIDSEAKSDGNPASPSDADDSPAPGNDTDNGRWGILAIAGLSGFCCVGLLTITAGAAVTGGAAAGVTATASGGVGSVGGLLVTVLATALPLAIVGLWFRRRAR